MNVVRMPSITPRLLKPNFLQIPCNKHPVVSCNKLPVVSCNKLPFVSCDKLSVINTSQEIATTTTTKSKFINSKVKKPKRKRQKIKDYMLTETPLSVANSKNLISSLTNENTNSSNNQISKKIINLFPRKLMILKKSATSLSSGAVKGEASKLQAKSTIKDYLQSRALQSVKCSRSKLLKNKENLVSNN